MIILNFPCVAILDFVTSYNYLYCQEAEVRLCETTGQQHDVMNSKMAAPEKFKSENRRKSNPVLFDREILFPCFPSKFDFDISRDFAG